MSAVRMPRAQEIDALTEWDASISARHLDLGVELYAAPGERIDAGAEIVSAERRAVLLRESAGLRRERKDCDLAILATCLADHFGGAFTLENDDGT